MKETIYKRIFVIVLDSLGIGAMPDSEKFGDRDVDTFGHILDRMGTLEIPNLQKLGMLNLHTGGKMYGIENPVGKITRLKEASNGKDTVTGHWEMMGIYTEKPFKTFTEHGFPPELIAELEKRCGKKVIGNRSESGTKIIEELGEEEIETGAMIVYTSADSVLQICGNEETFDLANLYRCCEIAREITMKDEWRVGRVIARPYVGKKKGEFKRTSNRREYSAMWLGSCYYKLGDEEKAKEMRQKLRKAEFDFNDFLDQMRQIKKMGGMNSILNMMPGMSQMKGNVEIDEKSMDKVEAIILSMTKEERANPSLLNPSRKQRIAKGAGVDIAEVNRIVKQFEQSKKLMKQLPGMMGGGKRKGLGGLGGMLGKMKLPF